MTDRVDWIMRQRCDDALLIAATDGVRAAATYMYDHMVPLHVAIRLLA